MTYKTRSPIATITLSEGSFLSNSAEESKLEKGFKRPTIFRSSVLGSWPVATIEYASWDVTDWYDDPTIAANHMAAGLREVYPDAEIKVEVESILMLGTNQ